MSHELDAESLVAQLREDAGDALRYVALYDTAGYEAVYVRRDVDRRRADRRIFDELFEELLYEGTSREYIEEKLDSGSLGCVVHAFEEVYVCNFLREDETGFVVTLDPGTDVRLGAFVERYETFGRPAV